MPVFRKEHLQPYQQELEAYYLKLRRTLEGTPPNPNLAEQYHVNPDQFRREFTEVDLERLDQAIKYFKVAVEGLRQLKKKARKPQRLK